MSLVVQCDCCGGTVVFDAELEASKCLFCGSAVQAGTGEEVEEVAEPNFHLTIEVDRERADEQYREWAQASWWSPKELRSLSVELRLMYLPAWWIRGEVESHWSGLMRAATKSGKTPVSGIARATYDDIIAASQGVTSHELQELLPYRLDARVAWVEEDAEVPFEVPGLSEEAARAQIHEQLSETHLEHILIAESLLSGTASSFVHEKENQLYMLPVYIGAFRFRERPWRFLINAQTGEVVGDPPVDRKKVAAVAGAVLLGLFLLVAFAGS